MKIVIDIPKGAYDCPWCGCQHIVNTKYMTMEEHLKKMSKVIIN